MTHTYRSRSISSDSHSLKLIRRMTTNKLFLASAACLMATLVLHSANIHQVEAATSARVRQGIDIGKQANQYFLNEFCDLDTTTIREAKRTKHAPELNSVNLTSQNSLSSFHLLPKRLQSAQASWQQPSVPKQLNCSVVVNAPESYGLILTVNSISFPINSTKFVITLNHDSVHAHQVHLERETYARYLSTLPKSSKIAVNIQSSQPIDWSHISFDILFTVYNKGKTFGGCPNEKWFNCGDNICIPASLVCDRNKNCPDGNDEMIFYKCYSPLFWSIAASTSLVLIFVIIIAITIFMVRRRGGTLNSPYSLSNNALASEGDLIHDNNSSKLDLTQEPTTVASGNGSYLASNLYLGGFENPVWTNGTLTKQSRSKQSAQATQTQNSTAFER